MENKMYYVAIVYKSPTIKPLIVESFDNELDANSYAALMSRTKQRNYIVFEARCTWLGNTKDVKASEAAQSKLCDMKNCLALINSINL